eukprot:scaffold281929_cov30-Tisochrysis_lutea.AAC.2
MKGLEGWARESARDHGGGGRGALHHRIVMRTLVIPSGVETSLRKRASPARLESRAQRAQLDRLRQEHCYPIL